MYILRWSKVQKELIERWKRENPYSTDDGGITNGTEIYFKEYVLEMFEKRDMRISQLSADNNVLRTEIQVLTEHVNFLMEEKKREEDEKKNAERLARYNKLKAEMEQLEKLLFNKDDDDSTTV